MNSIYGPLRKVALVTLALGALAQPAWARINITKCQTITKPGSYRLTTDLHATGTCLVIASDDVSLDLDGHTITGPGPTQPAPGATEKVGVRSIVTDPVAVEIRNGAITQFDVGIEILSGHWLLELLHVSHNQFDGMRLTGSGIVRANIADHNGDIGINGGGGPYGDLEYSLVQGNIAEDNGYHGISVVDSSQVLSNQAHRNGHAGIYVHNFYSRVSSNHASENSGPGLEVSCPGFVLSNTAKNNGGGAIVTSGSDCRY
jgi:hypothetical protein